MTELDLLNTIDHIFSGLPGIDMVHENETYHGSAPEWIRACAQTADGKRMTLGNDPLYRYKGICFVQIFVKPDTGAGRALEIADMITPLLRDKKINGVQFFVPVVRKVGENNGWYQINVLTDFYMED